MSDLQKKRKKFKKTSQVPKKVDKKEARVTESQSKFAAFLLHIRQKKVLLKISLLFALFNLCLFISVVYLYQNTQFFKTPQDDKVLSVESFIYPRLEASTSALLVSTPSYIVYDPESRVIVAEKNSNLRFAPASSVKIMTALVALDSYDLTQNLTVPSLSSVLGSSMGLFEGEEISVEDLLYGLMLPSGNDAAYTLAYNFPSGYIGFINTMNKKAADMGLGNTYYIDPAGYDDLNYTTGYDMVRLGAKAMENKTFQKIVSTKNMLVTDKSGKIQHALVSLNELLGYKGVDGIKTGFTEEAGGVLVTSLVHEDRRYIIVLFRSEDRFFDTRSIMESIIDSIRLTVY